MIYLIAIWSLVVLICAFVAYQLLPHVWRKTSTDPLRHLPTAKMPKTWERGRESVAVVVLLSGIVFHVSGLFGLLELPENDSSTMSEYNQTLNTFLPQFKGTYECQGTQLRFKGVDQVQFEHKGITYQVNFPLDTNLARWATYCPLNFKLDAQKMAERLKSFHDTRVSAIDTLFQVQTVPLGLEESDRVLMQKILNTFEPKNQKAVKELVDKHDNSNKLHVQNSQPTAIKVPALAPSKNSTGTITLSDQVMQDNISAQ